MLVYSCVGLCVYVCVCMPAHVSLWECLYVFCMWFFCLIVRVCVTDTMYLYNISNNVPT